MHYRSGYDESLSLASDFSDHVRHSIATQRAFFPLTNIIEKMTVKGLTEHCELQTRLIMTPSTTKSFDL